MPNWCANKLTVSHNDQAAMDRFVKAYNAGTVCNEFLPKPKDIGEGWYGWCIQNWGTKWDIGADIGTDNEERYGLKATVVDNEASCSFDSAWSPPLGLYRELVLQGYRVAASYFEPNMAFCGTWIDDNDNYIEYHSKDEIPVGIWNDFNMDELFSDEVVA